MRLDRTYPYKYCFPQETYPSTPPVWFADTADTEDLRVTNAVQVLSNTTGIDNHVRTPLSFAFITSFCGFRLSFVYSLFQIINQVFLLLKELCRIYQIPEPPNLDSLRIGISQFCTLERFKTNKMVDEDDDSDSEDDEDLEEDIPLATEEENDLTNKNKVILFSKEFYWK